MYIKPLDNPKEYDVFLGHGWENWVRVKYNQGRIDILRTSVDEIDPGTLRLIFFKIKKLRKKEKAS